MIRVSLSIALIALTALALMLASPPNVAVDVPMDGFSTERALAELRVIADAPRPTGSSRNEAVRAHLVQTLKDLGLAVEVDDEPIDPSWSKRTIEGGIVHNIVARLPGTAGDGALKRGSLLLAAHYDSVPRGPGASDDGVGVVTILETLRALRAGSPLNPDLIVLLSDGEELGLLGARAFAERNPLADRVAVALNFEARGSHGVATMFETSADAGALVDVFRDAAPHPFASSLSYEVYRRMPNGTDFTVFKKSGMQGLNFAFIGGLADYHQPTDDIDHLDPRSLQHTGETCLALARALGKAPLHPFSPKREVYFNPLGSLLVVYGDGWIVPLEILAVGIVVLGFALARKRKRLRPWRTLLGAFAFMLGIIGSVVLGVIVAKTSAAFLGPRGPILHMMLVGSSIVLLTLFFAGLLARWFGKWASPIELSLGIAIVYAVATLALSSFAPLGSYVFSLPLMGLGIGICALGIPKNEAPSYVQAALLMVGASIPILLGAPLIQQLHVALGWQLPALTAVVTFLFTATAAPALFAIGPLWGVNFAQK